MQRSLAISLPAALGVGYDRFVERGRVGPWVKAHSLTESDDVSIEPKR